MSAVWRTMKIAYNTQFPSKAKQDTSYILDRLASAQHNKWLKMFSIDNESDSLFD